jgi:hypothetical protein
MRNLTTALLLPAVAVIATALSACTSTVSDGGPSPLGLTTSTPPTADPSGVTGPPSTSDATPVTGEPPVTLDPSAPFELPTQWDTPMWTVDEYNEQGERMGGYAFGTEIPVGWTEEVIDDLHRVFTDPSERVTLDVDGTGLAGSPADAMQDAMQNFTGVPSYQPLGHAAQPYPGELNGSDGAVFDYLLTVNGEQRYFEQMWIGSTDITYATITIGYPMSMSDPARQAAQSVFSRAIYGVQMAG